MPQSKAGKQMLDPSTDSISVLTPSLNLKHNAEKLFPICATGVLKREVEKKVKSCENASAPQQGEEWKQAGRGFLLLCTSTMCPLVADLHRCTRYMDDL